MNAVKEKWVKALRSGEYEQGKGRLKSGDKFCCLGVLCDLAAKEGRGTWKNGYFNGHAHFLPLSVLQWVGLPNSPLPVVLSTINDAGTPFAKIADIIEREG